MTAKLTSSKQMEFSLDGVEVSRRVRSHDRTQNYSVRETVGPNVCKTLSFRGFEI
jgi:hypothetical protein